jgi:hypothetical protein
VAPDPLLKPLEPRHPVLIEHDQLTIECHRASLDGVGQVGQLGESAGQGATGAAVDDDLVAGDTDDRPPAVPLDLQVPALTVRWRAERGQHRRDGRRQCRLHNGQHVRTSAR